MVLTLNQFECCGRPVEAIICSSLSAVCVCLCARARARLGHSHAKNNMAVLHLLGEQGKSEDLPEEPEAECC